jgi:putative SOS response-associated peptidase YedK
MEDALILERFGLRVRTAIYKARYNCAPTQNLAVIANEAPDELRFYRWGLIPSWAKEASIGSKLINARAETLAEKPSFRQAFRSRRCLVPATGFYEWKRDAGKTPYHVRMKNGDPFCFAGLWEQWKDPAGEEVRSFTIITTTPNSLMAPIHDRMPVILSRQDEARWLSPLPGPSLEEMLRPFQAQMMEAYPVTKRVNSPANDIPQILEPDTGLF